MQSVRASFPAWCQPNCLGVIDNVRRQCSGAALGKSDYRDCGISEQHTTIEGDFPDAAMYEGCSVV